MYIGNDLQVAYPSYKIIDDISSSFNGSTTSFALQVGGSTPVPFPINTQQVMISVNGVIQEPDPTGSAGFKLQGSNIVFSSAPANGHAFFGVINAGADYITAGSKFPDGTVASPSFTFESDTDTGFYRIGSGSVGFASNGVKILDLDGNGLDITGTCTATLFSGSGASLSTLNATNLSSGTVAIARLGSSGTASSSTFLRGDGAWAAAGGLSSDAQENTVGGTNAGDSFSGTSATKNTLIGYDAGTAVTTGDWNVAIGNSALKSATSAGANVVIGWEAGQNLSTATKNTLIGWGAAKNGVVTGAYNVCLGGDSGYQLTTGHSNVLLGTQSGYGITTGYENTYIGQDAGGAHPGTGNNNIGIGHNCMQGAAVTGSNNIGMGQGTFNLLTSGSHNVAAGYQAGHNITTAWYNINLGYESGKVITTGGQNISIGYQAGHNITTATNNVAIGEQTLHDVTTGNLNIGIGKSSGEKITTGGVNIAIGWNTMQNNQSGSNNVAVGYAALQYVTGGNNTAIGNNAGEYANAVTDNTFIGFRAGAGTLRTGSNNICIGHDSDTEASSTSNSINLGDANITKFRIPGINFVLKDNGGTPSSGQVLTADGSGEGYWAAAGGGPGTGESYVKIKAGASLANNGNTTYAGYQAGNALAAGNSANTLFGYQAGTAITSGDNNTCIGAYTGLTITTGEYNICMGYEAGDTITTGANNIAIGLGVLGNGAVTSSDNIGLGQYTMWKLTSGQDNIAIGRDAGKELTTQSSNVHIGSYAGEKNTNSGCTYVGHKAAAINVREENVAIGYQAMDRMQYGIKNVFVGYNCGRGAVNASLSQQNTGVGMTSLQGLNGGNGNTCYGYGSGASITTGGDNTLVGKDMGGVTTGSKNLFLGVDAGSGNSPSGNITTGSNNVVLGGNSITNLYCADTSISSSDQRDKTDITDFTHGLNWVNKLKPVTYRWDKRTWYNEYNEDGTVKTAGTRDGSKKTARQHIGFLAQDVLAIEQADGFAGKKDDMLVVNLNEDDTAYGLKYERLVPVLVNAIKELAEKNTALETRLTALESA